MPWAQSLLQIRFICLLIFCDTLRSFVRFNSLSDRPKLIKRLLHALVWRLLISKVNRALHLLQSILMGLLFYRIVKLWVLLLIISPSSLLFCMKTFISFMSLLHKLNWCEIFSLFTIEFLQYLIGHFQLAIFCFEIKFFSQLKSFQSFCISLLAHNMKWSVFIQIF